MIRIKTAEQIEGIRASCALLSRMFAYLKPLVLPGAMPRALDKKAQEFILDNGGLPAFLGYEGFPASLCFSVNEIVIHGIPGSRPLKEGDIVGMDCGIDLYGYISDAAISLPVGEVSEDAQGLMRVTRECLERGIAAAQPGKRIHDISRAIFSHATAHGYGVVRQYCGHGVGLAVHEDPEVPNYPSSGPNPRLLPGMVIAIEPMINLGTGEVRVLADDWSIETLDRKISAHYEHTVLIGKDGPEVLTSW